MFRLLFNNMVIVEKNNMVLSVLIKVGLFYIIQFRTNQIDYRMLKSEVNI